MTTKSKVIVSILIIVLIAAAALISRGGAGDQGTAVRMEPVELRDLAEFVEASGNIRAVRTVDVSSDVSAKVADIYIEEGDYVTRDQMLLTLEPDRYRAAVDRTEAALAQARAGLTQQRANLASAQRVLDRNESLHERGGLVSVQALEDSRTQVAVAEAVVSSAEHGVDQAVAAVDEAREELSKTIFTAPMDGRVTRLNVEEGETVIIGTMNNPGSLVLTISDLSVMEVVVEVDETSVPRISVGDSAAVRIDAFPDSEFSGRVTEIGNSAIVPPSQQGSGQQAAIDFEVVITLDSTDADLRPDLSATAEIVTEESFDALSVPFVALTARAPTESGVGSSSENDDEEGDSDADSDDSSDEGDEEPVEGVFLVVDGIATFTAVEVGIAGRNHFEVISGVSVGDTVVAGPYQTVRSLRNGTPVRASLGPTIN